MTRQGKVLITGGAGYIGSHAVLAMKEQGIWEPIVVDDFSRGNRDLADRLGVTVCAGSLSNEVFLEEVFASHKPAAVMHFAAFAYVGESTEDPERYYLNNVVGTLKLFAAMRRHDVKKLIFSSTCATYGEPPKLPIDESCSQSPVNPYGRGKLMVEQVLRDYDPAYGLTAICFRYFNAAGADPELRIGERHDPETHLIPLAIKAAVSGKPIKVFGNDYPTPDGTCIRDYIHVLDIADAHLRGLDALTKGQGAQVGRKDLRQESSLRDGAPSGGRSAGTRRECREAP